MTPVPPELAHIADYVRELRQYEFPKSRQAAAGHSGTRFLRAMSHTSTAEVVSHPEQAGVYGGEP